MRPMIRQGVHAQRSLIGVARDLRREQTEAERALWAMLRGRDLFGLKFRRQHQVGNFVVDFYCRELKLVIELDGADHFNDLQQTLDTKRTESLQRMGMTVIRFENQDVAVNPTIVRQQIERIASELERLRSTRDPSTRR